MTYGMIQMAREQREPHHRDPTSPEQSQHESVAWIVTMSLPPAGPDRTCSVTGASSGIGLEIAKESGAARSGVTLVARREEVLKGVADDLAAAHGVRTEVLAVDLTDDEARAGIPKALADRGVTVDVLVNNAGLSTTGPVHQSDRARELGMIRTNVEAVVRPLQHASPRHGGARHRRGSQCGFDGGVPTVARTGRIWRDEVVRPFLHVRAARRVEGHRASPPPFSAPARSTRDSARPPASVKRTPTAP